MNFKNNNPAPATPRPVKPGLQKAPSDRRYYLLILVFSFILYGNTIKNRYSIDDFYVTGSNPLVQQGIKAIPAIFSSYYISINAEEGGQHNFGYRPIAKTTFAIERQLFGENPHISHFINILLYALTGIQLFRILRRLLKNYHLLLPFLTVMFFMVHPLHTEVVASLKNREEILSFLGALIALHYFLKFQDSGKKLNILWGSLAFGLGFLSKANIMTFLAVIPLVMYFFTEITPKKNILLSVSMILMLAAALLVPRLFLGAASRPMQFIENPLLFDVPFVERIGTSMLSLLFYLKMLVFPHPLIYYYGFCMIPVTGIGNPLVWISLIIHLAMLGYAVWKIREKHLLSFAILFYLVNISLYSNMLAPLTGMVAERSLFIALIGFCLALVYGLFRLSGSDTANPNITRKTMNYVILASVILAIPAVAKTIDRNNDWKDELTLYAADAPHQKNSAKANFIYATNLRSTIVDRLKAGVPREQVREDANICITHFKRATKVYPVYADAWNNLGEVYVLILNEPDSAIQYFKKAVDANPEFTAAYYNLGYTYQVTDQAEKAIPEYEKALELEPYEIRAMSNLAQLYHKTGQEEKAIRLNEDIIMIEPTLDLPYINLGAYAMRNGETAKALEYFEKAIEINPDNFELNMKLRSYFQKVGDSIKSDYYLDLARRSGKTQ
ncbi:MAG: tetratricopeptide repeat protein [Bacteroidota bacterium]